MKRLLLAVSLVLAACATGRTPGGRDLVTRAVEAVGGAEAVAGLRTISVKGTARYWEPEQSVVAGGDARLAGESKFEMLGDYGAQGVRIDWVRELVYPSPRTYTFTELVRTDAGYVLGVDSTSRNKQSLETKPPGHAMSTLRLAAAQRELLRAWPAFLLDMWKNPERATAHPDVTVGDVGYPAVEYRTGHFVFVVLFDRQTGLPARIRTLDYDNIWGDVTYDLVLSEWTSAGSLRVATERRYELNERLVAQVTIADLKPNAPARADRFAVPGAIRVIAGGPAPSNVPYQWVLRRQYIGTYLDSDQPGYDTRGATGWKLEELGPGIQHVVGGTHNSLIVEMKDHLVVFDAPVSDAQSNWTLAAAKEKFPGKPVKHLVLTHHHMDHAGGLRAYAAQGATIVVGKGNGEHFRRVLAAPFTRNPDLKPHDLKRTPVVEVEDSSSLSDGTREVAVYLVENEHAAGMLIGYVVDARLAFVTDLWSPGRESLGGKLTSGQAALVAAVKKAGIGPLKFAGGHGTTADYAPLAELEGK